MGYHLTLGLRLLLAFSFGRIFDVLGFLAAMCLRSGGERTRQATEEQAREIRALPGYETVNRESRESARMETETGPARNRPPARTRGRPTWRAPDTPG